MGDIADDLKTKAEDEFYGDNNQQSHFKDPHSDVPIVWQNNKKYAMLFGHMVETRYRTDDMIDDPDDKTWTKNLIPVPEHWLGMVVRNDEIVYRLVTTRYVTDEIFE